LENEHWWGGAVLDVHNSPLDEKDFYYGQFADCKGNQSAPLFISNKGRYIWSEKPLLIGIKEGKITIEAHNGKVISCQAGETLRDAFLYASSKFFFSAIILLTA